MRRLSVAIGLLSLAFSGVAFAALAPGRTVIEPSRVTALGVAHRSVVYAVDATSDRNRCAYVRLWNTATRGLWTFGEQTTRICKEGPSTGSGISSVATSGRRVFWVTYVGGNIREYDLWTATPMRKSARRLAEASTDVDSGDRPLVLGAGTREGVPYAVGATITYVGDDGRRLFRVSVGSPVRTLAAGIGPGAQRVVASLADGRIVVLSKTGNVIRTSDYEPETVTTVLLALPGAIVQTDAGVRVGATSVALPARATLLDYRQGRVVYAKGAQVRSRRVATSADTLLQTITVPPGRQPLFSTDAWGSAWAEASAVSWRSGPLP